MLPLFKRYFATVLLLGLSSAATAQDAVNTNAASWYKPPVMVKWQIQLQGKLDTTHTADLYDIDLFDSPASLIEQLHVSGRHVLCYFSAGSAENWRADYRNFLPADKGRRLSGWAGEKWLDVRSQNVRKVMAARMDLAKEKHCDGVDADNVDGYSNKTGFPLTAADQIGYNTFLANEAHKRGLAIALKNDTEQVSSLANSFDFAVNEQCFRYKECSKLAPFISAGKPVLNIEYQKQYVKDPRKFTALCKSAAALKFSTLVLPLGLNGKYRYSCL